MIIMKDRVILEHGSATPICASLMKVSMSDEETKKWWIKPTHFAHALMFLLVWPADQKIY